MSIGILPCPQRHCAAERDFPTEHLCRHAGKPEVSVGFHSLITEERAFSGRHFIGAFEYGRTFVYLVKHGNVYASCPGIDGPRSAGLRRVHFGPDGYPVLDLTEERDLSPELVWVSSRVTVKK